MAANTNDDMIIAIGVDPSAASRGLKKLQADVAAATGSVQKQFDSVGRGIDRSMSTALQSRINAMVGIGTKGAKEWSGALADQGKELERLRAKYSPLFTTINNYKTAVADIRRAHALGAISATEMTSAIQRERQAALASTAAIKGRNAALADTPAGGGASARGMGNRAFNTSNLAAQGFDVATTAAFMPFYTVALQQGPQVAQVFNDIRASGQRIGPAVAGAFMQILNPVSLVTIGVIAAASALIQYVASSKDVKGADDILKGHAETISLLKERYGEAASGLREYARESVQVARADLEQRLKDARAFVAEQAKVTASYGPGLLTSYAPILKDMDPKVVRDLRTAFADLNLSIQRGEPDILRFREALSRIANDESVPDSIRKMAQEYRQFDEDTLKVAKNIPSMLDQMKLIEGVANGQTDAVNRLSTALRDLSKIGVAPLTQLEEAERLWREARRSATSREERDDADAAFRDAQRRFADANPTVVNPDGRTVSVPTPEGRPTQLGDEPNKKAETAAQRTANAYRDLLKSADDRIAQLQLETGLLGTYGAATEAARFRMDLLQQAEDKGRSLNEKQRAEIEQKVALYAKFSEALAQAKLQQDLLNKARFSSLSKQDQQIVTTLRQYGLSEDLGSTQAAMIRQSLESDEIREGVSSFLGDFKSALMENGGDIGDAFGTALLNALMNSMNKQWESLFDLIGSGIASMMKPGAAAGVAGFPGLPAATGVASVASAGGVSSAVDLASGLFGASESKNRGGINSFLKKGGVDIDAAQTAWCAAFVNSSLEQVGVKGSGSLTANSFQNWGSSVNLADVMRGDVLLQSRGLGAGQAGGHVGFATGSSRMGASGLQLEMLSGNSGDAVSTEWVNAIELQARRATEASAALSNVGSTAQQATTGLGQFGSALSGTGGGGGGGWLSTLLGSSSQWSMAKAGLLKPGLFADGGGVRGPGGPRSDVIPAMLSNGEFVVNAKQTQKHRAILEAINNGSFARLADGGIVAPRIVSAPRTPRLNARGGSQPVRNETALTVQIQGANGDEHVRMLVKQGVEAGLHASRENDRRGGFGQMQTSYIAQKG